MAADPSKFDVETLVKVVSAAVVVLYVIGLIVSNMHFAQLGITDFPSLNPHNAMTGFVFMVWLAVFVLILAPISISVGAAFVVYSGNASGRSKVIQSVALIVAGLFGSAAFALLAGIAAGSVLPWGSVGQTEFRFPGFSIETISETYSEGWKQTVRFAMQFMDAFGFLTLLPYAVMTCAVCVAVTVFFAESRSGTPDPWLTQIRQKPAFKWIFGGGLAYLTIVLLFPLMNCFAVNVFPNLQGNLGGRQPQIAQLALRHVGEYESKLFCVAPPPSGQDENLATDVGVVAIWHQSEKFMYVMPLPERATGASCERNSSLIALDSSLVKSARYVRKYVRVTGSRVVSVIDPAEDEKKSPEKPPATPAPTPAPASAPPASAARPTG